MNPSELISKVSGQFGKSLILGSFLPTLLFVLLGELFIVPLLPADRGFFAPLVALLGKDWELIGMAFMVVLGSGLLFILNVPIIRVFEGYPWESTFWGRWSTAYFKQEYYATLGRWNVFLTLAKGMSAGAPQKLREGLRPWAVATGERLSRSFPIREDLILPTRLGNVIRSFEYYADRQYGIDPIEGWSRLIAKIDKDYAAAIDDAKTSFDFALNVVVLSALFGALVLLTGIASQTPFSSPLLLVGWRLTFGLSLLAAWVMYGISIERAAAWGNLVKGAFDLYRRDLLRQLGFSEMPKTLGDERELWDKITRRYVYVESERMLPMAYEAPSATGRQDGKPPVYPPVTRGVQPASRYAGADQVDASFTVTLSVAYPQDSTGDLPVTDVVVTDRVPDGFAYVWNPQPWAQVVGGGSLRMRVTGTNPYQFHVGRLDPGTTKIIQYRIVKLAK